MGSDAGGVWRGLRQRLRAIEAERAAVAPVDRARSPCAAREVALWREEAISLRGERAQAPSLVPDDAGLLFFDVETTGLGTSAAIFLAGALAWDGARLWLVQGVAKDVAEERLVAESFAGRIAAASLVVTFNGRAFDLPLLRRRLAFHRLPPLPATIRDIDLLHAIRRRYRGVLDDCRLATVERGVLGDARDEGDLPSAEVPLRFRDYLESGDVAHLEPVLLHNRRDLISLARLWTVLRAGAEGNGTAGRVRPAVPSMRGSAAPRAATDAV